jgi:sphinganine C4-monooxygenase
MDTVEYWGHRLLHLNFMYGRVHKDHHQLVVPYAFGALYNSYSEVLVIVPLIVVVFLPFSWLDFIMIQSISYVATVKQHCADQNHPHMLHHNGHLNKNFHQPFFYFWDKLMGTYFELPVEGLDH